MGKKFPPTAKYVAGFKTVEPEIKDVQLRMLKNHYGARGHRLTANKLGKSVGYKDHRGINRWYGELAKILGEAMGFDWRPEWRDAVSVLEFSEPQYNRVRGEDNVLTMRPQVVQALEKLGWVKKRS